MRKGKKAYLITRDVYKSVKKYDHQQMESFLENVYRRGYEDGKKEFGEWRR